MKLFRFLALCVVALGLLALVSCGSAERLDVPRGVEVEYETLTLRWSEVKGAKIYTLRIEAEGKEPTEVASSKNYYSLESLSAGKYSITVRAGGAKISDSNPSAAVEFIRDEECGLEFKLLSTGEYEVCGKGVATGVIEIPSTYRQKAVIAIGENAFFDASDVSEVKLPESIRSVGAFAFANCSYLEKINLPSGLLSLGESAFSGCRILGGVLKLPHGLKEIPKGAYAYCSALEEVEFSEGVQTICENAFTDCSNIKSLTFPKSLKKIERFAFAACADATEISFSEGIVEIGEFAFSKALSLSSLTLPNSLQTIGKGAFYHSSQLASVTLGSGITEIGDSAFLDTAVYESSATNEIYVGNWFIGLKDNTAPSLNIKPGTLGIANNALYANQSIASVELPDSVEYIGTLSFGVTNLVSIVIGSGVKRISDQAFLYCDSLIDVVLGAYDYAEHVMTESSLLSIGNYAFMNCSQLQRIDIPDTVKDIGAYAFRNTDMFKSSLTGAVYADNWIVDFNDTISEELVVDRGTVGIARYAFYNCQSLKSVKIDNSVKFICKGAFYNCAALERVVFPDTLARIEDYAFYSCRSLKLVSLPPMLREIGRAAFYQCGTADNYIDDTDSDKLEIPGGVTYIGDFAFFGCGYRRADAIDGNTETAGIDTMVIGSGVKYIGKCAFRGFASLKTVLISGAAMIGDKAFYECDSLESITVEGELLKIGNKAFYKCGALKVAVFPDTLLEVGDYAFYKCEALKSVRLGSNLQSIGDFAFLGNLVLEDIALCSTLASLGNQAFRDCRALGSLYLPASLLNVGSHAFYSCDALTLYTDAAINTAEWSSDWNSTFIAVVLGCELSPEGYIASVLGSESTVLNKFTDTVLSVPRREGYTFLGWSESPSMAAADYSMNDVANLKSGVKLYSVWHESE